MAVPETDLARIRLALDGARGPTGPQGPQGPPGTGTGTANLVSNFSSLSFANMQSSGSDTYTFRFLTASIVVPTGVTRCQVTSSVQTQPPASAPDDQVFFRNAVSRAGVYSEDGQYGHYLTNDGSGDRQPTATRASVFTVSPGQTVAFGVFFGGLVGGWNGSVYSPTTSYLCH